MKGMRIGAIGIILIMMLMSISVVYSQSDADIIAGLLIKRDRLTDEMNKEILVKGTFKTTATPGPCPATATECTWIGADGRVLTEFKTNGVLIKDVFTNPTNNNDMELTTEYSSNQGVVCYTLLNKIMNDQLKVCHACALTENQNYGAYQDQTVWDLAKGNTLRLRLTCCGVILTQGLNCCDTTHKCQAGSY